MSPTFTSGLAPQIQKFLDYKHSLGYKYQTGAIHLQDLDRFCARNGFEPILTRELVESWIMSMEDKNPSPYRDWLSPVREFGRYPSIQYSLMHISFLTALLLKNTLRNLTFLTKKKYQYSLKYAILSYLANHIKEDI